MSIKSDFIEHLTKKLERIEGNFKVECEEVGIDPNESCYYSLRVDEDGCPHAYGNSESIYSDGYDMGQQDGEWNSLKDLLTWVLSYEEKK